MFDLPRTKPNLFKRGDIIGDAAMIDELRRWEWREYLEPASVTGSLRRVSWCRTNSLCTRTVSRGMFERGMLR